MNNDLISRDALKKDIDFQYICECCHNNGNTCDICPVAEIEKKIDNAPTVEEKSYAIGYQDGAEDGLQDIRPEGKWIFDSEFTEFGNPYGIYKCDKCGGHSSNKYPFCFWCGADMRGKKHD